MYNAKYFIASPTYNKWVKLSAAGVHALDEIPDFKVQGTYFHLNHPIRYTYLVAPITAIHEIPNTRFLLLTLDDSSNATIDVKIERDKTSSSSITTTVPNLHILKKGYETKITLSGQDITLGTVIKAKCTIGHFRGVKQLHMKRCEVVRDTTAEAAAWLAMSEFKRNVLGEAWVLSADEMKALDERIAEDARREREQEVREEKRQRRFQRALLKTEQKREEKRKVREEKREKARLAAEREFNRGALV